MHMPTSLLKRGEKNIILSWNIASAENSFSTTCCKICQKTFFCIGKEERNIMTSNRLGKSEERFCTFFGLFLP